MPLQNRERMLVWITSVAAAGAAIWYLGIGQLYDQWAANQKVLDDELATFQDNVKTWNDADKIEKEYEKIRQTIPTESTDQEEARYVFQETVDAMATGVMKKKAAIGTVGVDPEPFKSIKKQTFVLLDLEVATDGTLESIAELLKQLDSQGYLVRKVSINQKDIDSPELHLALRVSRIVQVQEKPKPRTRRGH